MATRNDRRTVATRTAPANRKLTVRHAAPRPADTITTSGQAAEPLTSEVKPDEIRSDAEMKPAPPPAQAADDGRLTRRWRLAASLVVVLLGLLATGGVLARQAYDQGQLDSARQHALAAARQATVDFVSISAATIDRDLQRISQHATGEFKDEFTQDMAQVRAAVIDNKVDSRGTVLRAAVVSSSRSSAVVLVAVDATVKNTNAPDGRLSHYRIRVTMAAQSGRWLVAKLEFVG